MSARKKEIYDRTMVQSYLHARTVLCPSCTGLIPLSPTWNLSSKEGIRLRPLPELKLVHFEVAPIKEMSEGTIKKGIALCPLCGYVCVQGYQASEARAGRMGSVEYAHVTRRWYPVYTGTKAYQKKGPVRFYVPGAVLMESERERWRCLHDKGLLVADDDLTFPSPMELMGAIGVPE